MKLIRDLSSCVFLYANTRMCCRATRAWNLDASNAHRTRTLHFVHASSIQRHEPKTYNVCSRRAASSGLAVSLSTTTWAASLATAAVMSGAATSAPPASATTCFPALIPAAQATRCNATHQVPHVGRCVKAETYTRHDMQRPNSQRRNGRDQRAHQP